MWSGVSPTAPSGWRCISTRRRRAAKIAPNLLLARSRRARRRWSRRGRSGAAIKAPTLAGAPAISALLDALGCPGTEAFIERRVAQLMAHPDASLLVAVDDGEVIGVISLHFIPQLALSGDKIGRASCRERG